MKGSNPRKIPATVRPPLSLRESFLSMYLLINKMKICIDKRFRTFLVKHAFGRILLTSSTLGDVPWTCLQVLSRSLKFKCIYSKNSGN